MSRLTYPLLAVLLFAAQWAVFPARYRHTAPWVGDAAENLSIAQNLARGRGYRFDWDDPAFRRAFAAQNTVGTYDRILGRHGSYPTLARPPLMPLLLAGLVAVSPDLSDVFWRWRLLDMALCAMAGSLLCHAAVAARGRLAGAAAVAVFLLDPVRWANVPAWWSEGLAFDLTVVACWLLVDGRRRFGVVGYRLAAGATLGLLCLDRSVYVILIVPLAILLATAPIRWRSAMWITLVAVAVQLPWWTRNVIVAGRFVPLGTQGGFNLPDEYGPAAVRTGGNWDGSGIRDVWLPPTRPAADPPGWTDVQLNQVNPGDRRWAILLVDFTCTSTAAEVAVNAAGTRAVATWVAHHSSELPVLFARKLWTLTDGHRRLLLGLAVVIALGVWRSPRDRPVLWKWLAWAVLYAAAVGLTHVLGDRFLVPAMPPLNLAVAVSVAAVLRPIRRSVTPSPG